MAEVKLKAKRREMTGKGSARKVRAGGRVPAVLYGRDLESVAVDVDRREFVTALHTDAGMNVLLDIDVDGKRTLALARELQRDPVKGTLLHADFVKVDRKQKVEVEVPVHLVGEAPGAKEGGVLEHPLFAVDVRCVVTNVPEAIEADISRLQIGDAVRVSELRVPVDAEVLNDPDTVVASVAAPISEEELEAMEAEAGIEQEPSEAELEAAAEAAAAEEGEAAPEGEEGAPAEGTEETPEE
jgi:large subunit ribosomal protein L25